jgi:hypothetical protein
MNHGEPRRIRIAARAQIRKPGAESRDHPPAAIARWGATTWRGGAETTIDP